MGGKFGVALGLGRYVAADHSFLIGKQELLHLFFEEFPCLRVNRCQAIFIDQHGLVAYPRGPCFLGNIQINTLTQVARISRTFKAWKLFSELDALHHAGCQSSSPTKLFRILVTGAATPPGSSPLLYQTRAHRSITAASKSVTFNA